MRQSQLFTKTRKDAPKDEMAKNAQLLIRAGFIHKEMAGVYTYLPLGLRVLKNIEQIIREEMNALGGQELLLTALQEKSLWEKTDRWDDKKVDNWFKTKLKNETELGLGFTHEEELTALMRDHIRSFRDLPAYAYQFQTKFRNEARAKSGIMRGREFLMKDLYSFSLDEKQHADFYERAKVAYEKVFARVGLGELTYLTFASGGSFSKFSHEFQTLTSAGEDIIFICEKCARGGALGGGKTGGTAGGAASGTTGSGAGKRVAVNKEVHAEQKTCPECGNTALKEEKAVEVGNIFSLGTRFSDALDLTYVTESGEKRSVVMGSYGIGLGRVMGTVVEVSSDEAGIIWPESIAPFKVHLILLAGGKGGDKTSAGDSTAASAKNYADKLYKALVDSNIEVLYDDRELRAGEKFADADLIGIPHRVVVSDRLLAEGKLEVKRRGEKEARKISEKEFLAELAELAEIAKKSA